MRKIDADTIKIMSLFEKITGARLKDCIVNDSILFIVYPNQTGKAIGKNGASIRKIESLLNKKSVVKEFSEDKIQFVRNLIESDVESINETNGVIEIRCRDNKTRNMLIGRNKQNMRSLEGIIKRHFNINGLKVA